MNFVPQDVHHARSPSFISSLIHKQAQKAPALYLTGQRTYKGTLNDINCSEESLWNELISKKEIKMLLIKWKTRVYLTMDEKDNVDNIDDDINHNIYQKPKQKNKKDEIIQQLKNKIKQLENNIYNNNNNNNSNRSSVSIKIDINDIEPFRMVIHKTKNMKLRYSRNGGMKGSSKCKYFALIWIPSNIEDGMNGNEFNELIEIMRQTRYFINKLNKECIYISGPSYGNLEDANSDHRPNLNEDVSSKKKFDLSPLTQTCTAFSGFDQSQNSGKMLDIEIVVHELDREKYKQDNVIMNYDVFNPNVSGDIYDPPKYFNALEIEEKTDKNDLKKSKSKHRGLHSWHSKASKRRISFGASLTSQFSFQPMAHEQYSEIYSEKATLTRECHVFAFVWLHIKTRSNNAGSNKNKLSSAPLSTTNVNLNPSNIQPMASISDQDAFSQSLLSSDEELDEKEESIQLQRVNISNNNDIDSINNGVLPALSIMNNLHQQSYAGSRIYNVELMGYDECYENLDLVVNRYAHWREALLILIQCIFLPFFILFPPIKIRRLFNKNFHVKPRYRPCNFDVKFDDLDRTEQIPYDICALWKSYKIDKVGKFQKYSKKRNFLFRFISFICASLLIFIIGIGPVAYRRAENADDVKNLLFFDCFGPLLFYSLAVFTIMWWSGHSRVLIQPKEHMLLYYKLIIYRPIGRNEDNYNIPRTDWAALTNLSQPTALTAITYAYRKGFLELRTPTHDLLSKRRFNCSDRKSSQIFRIWFIYTLSIIIYFGCQNLENFEKHLRPFYVDVDNTYYYYKLIYCILSNILSWILLFGFILLWETMIDRISRQHSNIKTLSNLIIRNTYFEYIELDYIDNILSWLYLENYVKRKGMMLFSSLETPLFSLFLMSFFSWGGAIFCIFEGVGLGLNNDNSLFSNSALATWFYLAILSFIQVSRMLFYGHKFNRESEKQHNAIKSQCGTIHINNLFQFNKNDKLSLEEKMAMNSSQILLTHISYNEIVPKVFGIQFDKLTAKAAWTALFSGIPTILAFLATKINL